MRRKVLPARDGSISREKCWHWMTVTQDLISFKGEFDHPQRSASSLAEKNLTCLSRRVEVRSCAETSCKKIMQSSSKTRPEIQLLHRTANCAQRCKSHTDWDAVTCWKKNSLRRFLLMMLLTEEEKQPEKIGL